MRSARPAKNAAAAILSVFFACLRLVALACWLLLAPGTASAAEPYVGSQRCIACHAEQGTLWKKSHHAQSMQVANAQTVLGDFRNVSVRHHGQLTRFSRRGEQFLVRTTGPDGKLQDYPVAYTFGVYPLQQYLLALPGGRLQALGVAWDARPRRAGGQRWFHLYPEAPPQPGETTHWSGRDQNWNFMCAACHSTGLRRNYDLTTDRYATTWAEINVACESCHGPGSAHLAWATGDRAQRPPQLGLRTVVGAARSVNFSFNDAAQKIATPSGDLRRAQAANEVCFPCHSRRQELVAEQDPAAPFLDGHLPSLTAPGMYHADGQIDDEVFEAGSYAQSAMHRAGVVCTHCHDAHSLKLRAADNALCAQCHRPASYDSASHHRHRTGSEGAQCVSCHMPRKTYMGVHERRDHSLRVPRPDLGERHGSPDACTTCHRDRSAGWAASALRQWRGEAADSSADPADPHFTAAIAAAGQGRPAANWMEIVSGKISAWLRASLLSLLPRSGLAVPPEVLGQLAADEDGLVRLGAARTLATVEARQVTALRATVETLLADPLRAVRIEAARAVLANPALRQTSASAERRAIAVGELIAAEMAAAERPESQLNLATIHLQLGDAAAAEQSLHTALRLAPDFVPALVNLADFYRSQRRDADAEPLLRRAVRLAPRAAEPAHALGLLLVRTGKRSEAVSWLQRASELAPENARYARILDVARQEMRRSVTPAGR